MLFATSKKLLKFIAKQLSDAMIATLNPTAKKNAIFEGDFFALFCAFLAWGHEMSDAVVIYTNNAVREMP